jgi:hypothetical protein
VKHALASTSAWLSGDDLLMYITTAHCLVLHWQEQFWQYERLELEAFLKCGW